jgi:uncharacterized protein (TIGR00297 family)
MDLSPRFLAGLVVGAIVVGVGWRARSLSGGGAIAALAVGIAAAAAGPPWVLLLLFYFVTASAISRVGRRRKLDRTSGMIAKAGARDARQVLANGLAFAVAAAGSVFVAPPELWLVLGTGALAASAADTWATEIGTLLGGMPRSILTGRAMPVGASGGVTLIGLLASVAGAASIAAFAGLQRSYFPWIIAGGVAGALIDSIAGAVVQRRLWCDACGKATEMPIHSCGVATRRVGGLPFADNDAVNLLATIAGAVATLLLVGTFA